MTSNRALLDAARSATPHKEEKDLKAADAEAPTARKTTTQDAPAKARSARKGPVKSTSDKDENALTRLSRDPVAFVEAMPAVKRGSSRRPINTDLPGELGEWWVKWCYENNVSQRDVFRAIVGALKDSVNE